MKIIKSAILALILSTSLSLAQNTVNLEWDPNPATDTVTGYKVYEKTASNANPPVITWKLVGQTAATVTKFSVQNVTGGIHVYGVTAFNALAESERSNEATAAIISAPKGLRVVTVVVTP